MRFIANITATLAMFNQSRRKDEKALALYKKACDGNTNDSAALSAYALLLIRKGRFQEAEAVASRAYECVDQYAKKAKANRLKASAMMNRGLALWKMGRLDEAIKVYEKLHKHKRTGMIYGTLGFLYIARGDKTGDYARALEYNTEAVGYDDTDAVLLDNLAQTQMRLGDWEEAEKGFRAALQERAEQFDSMVCLARCLRRRGEKEEACAWMDKALKRPFSQLNTVERTFAEELKALWEKEDAQTDD